MASAGVEWHLLALACRCKIVFQTACAMFKISNWPVDMVSSYLDIFYLMLPFSLFLISK
jgi:hypothetical protein